jgi:hypothetical protein
MQLTSAAIIVAGLAAQQAAAIVSEYRDMWDGREECPDRMV